MGGVLPWPWTGQLVCRLHSILYRYLLECLPVHNCLSLPRPHGNDYQLLLLLPHLARKAATGITAASFMANGITAAGVTWGCAGASSFLVHPSVLGCAAVFSVYDANLCHCLCLQSSGVEWCCLHVVGISLAWFLELLLLLLVLVHLCVCVCADDGDEGEEEVEVVTWFHHLSSGSSTGALFCCHFFYVAAFPSLTYSTWVQSSSVCKYCSVCLPPSLLLPSFTSLWRVQCLCHCFVDPSVFRWHSCFVVWLLVHGTVGTFPV